MDKRRSRPNPRLRISVLIAAAVLLVSMLWTMSQSLAHTKVVRPALEVSTMMREIALDVGASDVVYISPDEQRAALQRLVKAKRPLYCGGTKKYAAFSFDDGPSATTPELVALLKDEGIPATWFDLGKNANNELENLRLQAGYGPIGNHTWDHEALTTLGNKQIKAQLEDTQEVFRQIAGQDWKMMRPPYGARDDRTEKMVRKLGYAELLWSADSQDALGKDWQTVAKNAIDGFGPGAMVLFHDGPAATIRALKERIIPMLRKSNITLVTVPDLLVLNPPSKEQLKAGPEGCRHAGRVNVTTGYFANPEGY